MEEIFEYVSRYDPNFRSRIRGATSGEIERLQELVGQPLPQSYRWFLEHMGHANGLGVGAETTTDISAVIRVYEELAEKKRPAAPPNGILIGVDGAYYDVALQETAEKEPHVLFTDRYMIYHPYAESLPKLLYRQAFRLYAPKRLSAHALYTGSKVRPMLDDIARLAAAADLKQQWFSDSVCYCGENDRAVLSVTQFERQGVGLELSAANTQEIAQFAEPFQRELGLQPA